MKKFVDCGLLVFAGFLTLLLFGGNIVVAFAGLENCPNFTTKSVRCPDAPSDYDNGECRLVLPGAPVSNPQLCTSFGSSSASSGNFGLAISGGSYISSNSNPLCYSQVYCTYDWIDEKTENGVMVSTMVCKKNTYDSHGYAYVAKSCDSYPL